MKAYKTLGSDEMELTINALYSYSQDIAERGKREKARKAIEIAKKIYNK